MSEFVARPLGLLIPAIVAGATVKVAVDKLNGFTTSGHYGYITQLAIETGTISANGSVLIAISDGRTDLSAVTDAATVAESAWCLYEPTTALLTTDSGLLAYAKSPTLQSAVFSSKFTKYLFIKSLSTFAMNGSGIAKVGCMVGVP